MTPVETWVHVTQAEMQLLKDCQLEVGAAVLLVPGLEDIPWPEPQATIIRRAVAVFRRVVARRFIAISPARDRKDNACHSAIGQA